MIANVRGRAWVQAGLAVAAIAGAGLVPTLAQQAPAGRPRGTTATKGGAVPASNSADQPIIRQTRHLVNPTDPAAIVNGEPITRQQLADECLAREGVKILETMIARKLVDQEIQKRHLQVTPAEVDAEIDRVAATVAHVTRDQWLATLAKERNISPSQYARDIIYPSIALRKLALPRVKVTAKEIDEAMESFYGDKLRCRIIMVADETMAKRTWEDLQRDPESWDALVRTRSIDQATRAVGGMLTEPIARHAEPRVVTDKAFRDLVDGDPALGTKPKDGDISSAIQISKETGSAWVIMKREEVIQATAYDKKAPEKRKEFEQSILSAKVEIEIGEIYNELIQTAAIENKLTGTIKEANEQKLTEKIFDKNVQLMSDPNAAIPPKQVTTAPAAGRARIAPPPGVSKQDLNDAKKLKK